MNYKKLIGLKYQQKNKENTKNDATKKAEKMYSIKPICLLQIWLWLSNSHHKKKNPVHSPGDKQKSTRKGNYSWYLGQTVIFTKQREHYRKSKTYKIHNYQFSKSWDVSDSIHQENLQCLTKVQCSKTNFTRSRHKF